jgi:hypothetical protein
LKRRNQTPEAAQLPAQSWRAETCRLLTNIEAHHPAIAMNDKMLAEARTIAILCPYRQPFTSAGKPSFASRSEALPMLS